MPPDSSQENLSLFNYLHSEFRRGYLLENDEERYTARREKFYAFFRIPWEIEKFITFGFLQCADSFFYVITFLPIRFLLVLWSLTLRSLKRLFGSSTKHNLLKPAEIIDLIKVILLLACFYAVSFIDTSVYYHVIKTQSTIKLYLFFNMLEIADRLMSSFGQDTLDALFWTATEPNLRKRRGSDLFTTIFHLILTPSYVVLHSIIVLMQALTLNVAINSDSKGLYTILISNNFIELKGAVFKKFDRNNLLQIACSDVRERFHYCVLLFVVLIQTMKEYSWKEDRLFILLPDCAILFMTEILIDWIKHAFITRFNDIPITAYRDYNTLIASDLIVCKQKNAYTDHSDLVARRMGFIPLPLTVVIYRVLSHSLTFRNVTSYIIFFLGFLCFFTLRIIIGMTILGKACNLVESVEIPRSRNASETVTETSTPQIIRRRTVSRELKEKIESKVSSPKVFRAASKEDISHIESPIKSLPREVKEDKPLILFLKKDEELHQDPNVDKSPGIDVVPSIGFLGDSRSGLMANSMVNISSLGLTQAIVDADSDECDGNYFNFSPLDSTKIDSFLSEAVIPEGKETDGPRLENLETPTDMLQTSLDKREKEPLAEVESMPPSNKFCQSTSSSYREQVENITESHSDQNLNTYS